MKTNTFFVPVFATVLGLSLHGPAQAQDLESVPPVVIKTVPEAGRKGVPAGITEIAVTFSKEMADGTWSWGNAWTRSTPESLGKPAYDADRRTCRMQVRLQPNTTYAYWLNTEELKNFKDTTGQPAIPYLLTFETGEKRVTEAPSTSTPSPSTANSALDAKLNGDQRRVLAWTDRQFRSFFDARTFEGLANTERAALETQLLDTLNGPVNRDYYVAIGSLAALRSTNALPKLRELAFERRDKNNRDRWMALRALSLIGDNASVPEMIHVVYHGNVNSRWWAQIALVQLTGQNFGKDWEAWGKWWNESGGRPAWDPQIIRWWKDQAEPDQLAASLAEHDAKFLAGLQPAAPAKASP